MSRSCGASVGARPARHGAPGTATPGADDHVLGNPASPGRPARPRWFRILPADLVRPRDGTVRMADHMQIRRFCAVLTTPGDRRRRGQQGVCCKLPSLAIGSTAVVAGSATGCRHESGHKRGTFTSRLRVGPHVWVRGSVTGRPLPVMTVQRSPGIGRVSNGGVFRPSATRSRRLARWHSTMSGRRSSSSTRTVASSRTTLRSAARTGTRPQLGGRHTRPDPDAEVVYGRAFVHHRGPAVRRSPHARRGRWRRLSRFA